MLLREFDLGLERWCNGLESECELVKRKTGEEYHMWLDKKIREARARAKKPVVPTKKN